MMTDGYPFSFDMKDMRGADDLMEYTLQYHFESEKSHHVYSLSSLLEQRTIKMREEGQQEDSGYIIISQRQPWEKSNSNISDSITFPCTYWLINETY